MGIWKTGLLIPVQGEQVQLKVPKNLFESLFRKGKRPALWAGLLAGVL
jgi:hypothetical protein